MSEFEQATRGIFPDRPQYAQRIWNAAITAAIAKCEAVRREEAKIEGHRICGGVVIRCKTEIAGLREGGGCF